MKAENESEQTSKQNNGREEEVSEKSIKEELLELLAKKYTRAQLINDFHYKVRTVDDAIKTFKESGGVLEEQPSTTEGHELLKIGGKDVIAPESILPMLHLPRDGDSVDIWKRGMVDGLSLLLLGARYAQLTGAGQAETLKTQLEVFKVAQEGTEQKMAQLRDEFAFAVQEDHRGILDAIKGQAIAQSPNPMATMMASTFAETFQPILANTITRVMSGFSGQPQPNQGQPPPQGQMPYQEQPSPTQPPQQQENPLIEHHKLEDLEK